MRLWHTTHLAALMRPKDARPPQRPNPQAAGRGTQAGAGRAQRRRRGARGARPTPDGAQSYAGRDTPAAEAATQAPETGGRGGACPVPGSRAERRGRRAAGTCADGPTDAPPTGGTGLGGHYLPQEGAPPRPQVPPKSAPPHNNGANPELSGGFADRADFGGRGLGGGLPGGARGGRLGEPKGEGGVRPTTQATGWAS